MGMFDSVFVLCPKCGELVEYQSKVGECLLSNYTLENAPENVLKDVASDSVDNKGNNAGCYHCGLRFHIEVRTTVKGVIVIDS